MIIPAGDRSTEKEITQAVLLCLKSSKHGEASLQKLFFELPGYIQLTPGDLEMSRSRGEGLGRYDKKWYAMVRNIAAHDGVKGNAVHDGLLYKRSRRDGGGYQLAAQFGTGSSRFLVSPQPMPLSDETETRPVSQSAYMDRFNKLVTRCLICGSSQAPFGIGVAVRERVLGEWFCQAHWKERKG